jgi:hypothetical protein
VSRWDILTVLVALTAALGAAGGLLWLMVLVRLAELEERVDELVREVYGPLRASARLSSGTANERRR